MLCLVVCAASRCPRETDYTICKATGQQIPSSLISKLDIFGTPCSNCSLALSSRSPLTTPSVAGSDRRWEFTLPLSASCQHAAGTNICGRSRLRIQTTRTEKQKQSETKKETRHVGVSRNRPKLTVCFPTKIFVSWLPVENFMSLCSEPISIISMSITHVMFSLCCEHVQENNGGMWGLHCMYIYIYIYIYTQTGSICHWPIACSACSQGVANDALGPCQKACRKINGFLNFGSPYAKTLAIQTWSWYDFEWATAGSLKGE